MAAPIRVWLEPGWDRGRVGAWLLDLPGCFTWGPSRDVALAHVPSAVGAFASWLGDHGATVDVPETDAIEVVEEVATPQVPDDRREAQATFRDDYNTVTSAALAGALERLAFVGADLEALGHRILAHEADRGPLPVRSSAEASGRLRTDESPERVFRHLSWSDLLLGGRLDGSRFNGGRTGDPLDHLGATGAWLAGRLASQHAANAGPVTDSAGETWTLAKVIRRAIAHRLDHLGELERRLARAERAADGLVLRKDVLVDPERLAELFRSVGWYKRLGDHARLARMLEGSTQMVSAWDGDRMVGFARAITDEAFNGYIGSVAVHPRWQGKGLGQRLIRELLENNDQVRFILSAVPGLEGFYESLGFSRDPYAMSRARLR